MKKILILMLGMIFLFSFISAMGDSEIITETRFYGKLEESLTIYDICVFEGSPCDNAFNCTFTILNPDQTILLSQVNATHTGDLFTYDLNSSQTAMMGLHEVITYCTNGSEHGELTFFYEINRSGIKPSTSQGILYFIIFIVFLVLFLLSLNAFVNTEWNDRKDGMGNIVQINYNKYLKFVYGFFTYFLLVFIFLIGKGITQNFLFLDTAFDFFKVGTILLLVIAGPGIIVATFFLSINIATDKRNAEALKRGLPFKQ